MARCDIFQKTNKRINHLKEAKQLRNSEEIFQLTTLRKSNFKTTLYENLSLH